LKNFFILLRKLDFKAIFIEKTDDTFLQLFRYLFVGGVSFVVDSAALYVITEMGVHYLVSGALAFVLGLCANFALSKLLVFSQRNKGKEKVKEIFGFVLITVTGLGITELLMWLFTEKLSLYYMLSKIIAAVIVLFWNFIMKKTVLYKQKDQK